ncbi:MAG: hypothetical protein PF518_00095 [Spirochaetaceae bacterium]|jgi:2-dehydropantoate 2-reductase|nr:hypothetical protein [Spirochaetaceae bacterium]
MRILIIGAGVTGSIYASFLISSKKRLEKKLKMSVEMNILARGETYKKIRNNGLKINHYLQKIITIDNIPVIKTLESNDKYDYVLIFLRKNQMKDLIPEISSNSSLNFVFIGNNGTGADEYKNFININRIILGFPHVGGSRSENSIISVHRDQPVITLGSANPKNRKSLGFLKKILKISRIKVNLCGNMESWLKYHIALVTPIANAIYFNGGDNLSLSKNNDVLTIMIRAIREGVKALINLKYPVKPMKLFSMMAFPDFLIKKRLKKLLASDIGKLVLYDHCLAAPEEMEKISMEFQSIIKDSSIKSDNINRLFSIYSK